MLMQMAWGTFANLGVLLLCILVTLVFNIRGHPSNGSLRLVGGRMVNEGTVLIYHLSSWGAICDDHWDINDANVVCNELGFAGAKGAPRKSQFGKGRRRIWLSGLNCGGHERHLTMCDSRGWNNHVDRCNNYRSSAGAICIPNSPMDFLADNTSLTTSESLMEPARKPKPVHNHTKNNSINATIDKFYNITHSNNYEIDNNDYSKYSKKTTSIKTTTKPPSTLKKTTLTLRSTSAAATTEKPIATAAVSTTLFTTISPVFANTTTTATTTPLPLTTLKSLTNATTRTSTRTPPPATTLKSLTNATTATAATTTTKSITSTPTTLTSLANSTTTQLSTTTDKRIYDRWVYNREMWRYFMYYRNGSFVTSKPDPRYFLQSTTTTSSTTSPPQPSRPRDSNSIYQRLGGGNNDNSTLSLDVISNKTDTIHPEIRNGYLGDQAEFVDNTKSNNLNSDVKDIQDEDAWRPITQKKTPLILEFRLVGGRNYTGYKEGRLEVRLTGSNSWGIICGDNWSFRATIVTCKHFGAGYARMNQTSDLYGGSHLDKVLGNIRCTGREQRLEDCAIETTELIQGKPKCSRPGSVAGVICETRLPDLEADVTAVAESIFLSDRYLYYLQCAYEEKCLSTSAYSLHGTRSWAYATRRLLHFSTIAKNIGRADFRPFIDRSQWEWHACHQHYHSMEAFSHYDIIDDHGNRIAEGHKASFCLEDSRCDRGVHPKYNCQNYGHQGISVGCQDSYLADIDCQWIDVTDVPAGQYKLKIEINPDMKVPEISYDNNVISCDLYFNTHQARAWNCKLESLL